MKLLPIFLPVIFITLLACKKDTTPPEPCTDNGLPCATTEGKNTFGCKVNGASWVAETPTSIVGQAPLTGYYTISDSSFFLQATKKSSDGSILQSVFLHGDNITTTGNYIMNVLSNTQLGYRDYKKENCSIYYHDTLNPGTLNITYLNSSETIISGTFAMDIIDTSCPDSIMHITDGRFDFNY